MIDHRVPARAERDQDAEDYIEGNSRSGEDPRLLA